MQNKGIFNNDYYKFMSLKERGITVGDLLPTIVNVTTTLLFINRIKDNKKQSNYYELRREIINYKIA